jgi:hypothetical protein
MSREKNRENLEGNELNDIFSGIFCENKNKKL